jgi:hypothetical protein
LVIAALVRFFMYSLCVVKERRVHRVAHHHRQSIIVRSHRIASRASLSRPRRPAKTPPSTLTRGLVATPSRTFIRHPSVIVATARARPRLDVPTRARARSTTRKRAHRSTRSRAPNARRPTPETPDTRRQEDVVHATTNH